MKNFFKSQIKSQKGINLISLSVAVIIILILTNMILYNVKDNLGVQKLKSMQSDIQNLRDKVSTYYTQYGKIPANTQIEYTNIGNIETAGVVSQAVDTGKFFVIDLEAMENVTLTYGQDYEKIRIGEATTEAQINQLEDLYIINETSHNIFYVAGIELEGEKFYTDYTAENIDTVAVDLRYIDNVKIPEGFYYAGGTKDTGIVISDVKGDDLDNSKHGNQFVWIPVENENDYVRNTSYQPISLSQTAIDDTDYLPNGVVSEKQAVINAGGFYLARFEAGKETVDGVEKVVSKKGATIWQNTTITECKEKAKTLVTNNNVKSALCSGIQWDIVMNFVDEKKDGNGTDFNVTQVSSTRHVGTNVATSGQNEADRVCNIYDLEGNAYEMVAERNTKESEFPYVCRGGIYENKNYSASNRIASNGRTPRDTFRMVLYVITDDNWTPTYDKTANYKDQNGDTAVIPAGFQVSRKQGENTINKGLVIRDELENEFVWVPVNKETFDTKFKRTEGYSNGSLEPKLSNYGEVDSTGVNSQVTESAITQQEAIKMYASVKENGGFYIARYEAGKEGTDTVVSKKNATVYNDIPWSSSTNMSIDTGGAVEKARKMASQNGYTSVTSTLCYGVQWDATLNFIDSNYITNETSEGKPNCNSDSYLVNSFGKGWYENNSEDKVHNTGVDVDSQSSNSIKNIYDMAGNVYEWTMESYNASGRTDRGASFNYSGSERPASIRGSANQMFSNRGLGFRVTLFINNERNTSN